jgi:hypothetical protein
MTARLRTGLIAAAFIGLGAAAVTGWVRKPAENTEPVAYGTTVQPPANAAVPANSVQFDQYGQPIASDGSLHTAPYNAPGAPAYQSYGAVPANGPAYDYTPLPAYGSHRYVRTIRPRSVGDSDRYEEPEHHHRRSTGKSVAIVAGSAGVGAAIGGIAGGGKGAGIGAVAGGAGGFLYDRLTHNR